MPDTYETDTSRMRGRDTAQMPHVSDAPQISPAIPGEAAMTTTTTWWSRLSWAAILAGVVVALLTQLFLIMIGIAFGAASLAPLSGGGASASSISTGAGIWLVISSILAALAGGYAAARFAGAQNQSYAGWHGLTTWALTALLISYFLSSAAGGLLGALSGAAKSTAQGAAQVAAPVLAQGVDPFSSIEQQLRGAASGNDPASLRDAAIAALRSALTGNEAQAAEARERAAQVIARAENISVEDARTQVQHYGQEFRQAVDQAKQQAAKAADEAAKAVSGAGIFGAIILFLGGLAGWLGGRLGMDDRTLRERVATASGRARR